MTRKARPATPGTKTADDIEAMIRVDHAGEYGAVRIYEGQLAVLGNTPTGDSIRRMAAEEQRHLQTFDRLVNERRVRPTALEPVWRIAGFALGAATALMGEKAAMACTAAVEEVIDEHYAGQISRLGRCWSSRRIPSTSTYWRSPSEQGIWRVTLRARLQADLVPFLALPALEHS
jgi:ubiquinone biosynthesis monooxygenase Coq7